MNTIGTLTNGHGAIITVVKKRDGGYHLMPHHQPIEKPTEIIMDQPIQALHSYRVHYQPKNATIDSGVMAWIQVKAANGIDALQRAAHLLGQPVWNAERVN